MLLYGGIATLALVVKPELFTNIQDIILLIAPFIGMFTWDKIKGGSIKSAK